MKLDIRVSLQILIRYCTITEYAIGEAPDMFEGPPAGGQVEEKRMAVVGGKPVRGIAIMVTNKPFLIPVLQNCVLPNILFIY